MAESAEFYRRHLPHWQPRGAVLFVTFRLKYSIPGDVMALLRNHTAADDRDVAAGKSFVKWDAFLGEAESGPRWLACANVPDAVREALLYRDQREYILYAFCIMPNHVHALFEPLKKDSHTELWLRKIMQSLKRQTARKANVILGREGAFWQDETYDRVVRNTDEFSRVIGYVLNNPVKAGLVTAWNDWPWTYCREGAL